ncbi:hypothetical protein GCM10010946_21430 [Undibacterium squillarum]|uniref:Uncharacterized protein n=1 Tax=Undibacterium squillarum TaxID=1131567 RepID=A0ABQ2Y0A2_9BURK|nr:hypothetical protein GCM10010946_21430 [Undibacterium squillarum]
MAGVFAGTGACDDTGCAAGLSGMYKGPFWPQADNMTVSSRAENKVRIAEIPKRLEC